MKKYILTALGSLISLAMVGVAIASPVDGMVAVGEPGATLTGYKPCALADASCAKTSLEQVQVKAFLIDAYEVTWADVKACVDEKRCDLSDWASGRAEHVIKQDATKANYPADLPVEDAINYCKANGKRLPEPEEWLLAAMGTELQDYVWGDDAIEGSWSATVGEVGKYPRDLSVWGAYDMGGNATEWVNGKYHGEVSANAKCGDPRTWPSMGNANLVKIYEQFGVHSAQPIERQEYRGFRCVKN